MPSAETKRRDQETRESTTAEERLAITAYERNPQPDGVIAPAPRHRDWMDAMPDGLAYRCLPMVLANQAGWVIPNQVEFTAVWSGGTAVSEIQFGVSMATHPNAAEVLPHFVTSHFGYGILTFHLPFLFRTSSGYNLWARGPVNAPKDGVQALDGIIETDWSHASFTMNWKITRPGAKISFKLGEPISQIVPIPRGLVERFDPRIRPIDDDPELAEAHRQWLAERTDFNKDLRTTGSEAQLRKWQKDYFQGRQPSGGRFDEHQTRLEVRNFTRVPKK
jgi:hypothetical protein